MGETIRVLITDDHAILREGIRLLLETEEGIEVIGEASNGEEAIEKMRTLDPDVILMDLIMPMKDGITTIKEIMEEKPDTRILVLSSSDDEKNIIPSIKAGAMGYILKESHPQDLINAIRNAHEGKPSLNPAIMMKLMGGLSDDSMQDTQVEILSEREIEVLKLVATGYSNQDIADELSVSSRTVGAHISHILKKLRLQNRTQAALYAIREGLVESPGK